MKALYDHIPCHARYTVVHPTQDTAAPPPAGRRRGSAGRYTGFSPARILSTRADTSLRYARLPGGSPADIYKSIFEGRPEGMPAWGRSIPPAQIWKVVAYIESKGGAFPGRLADRARQGDLGDEDTTSFSTLKGRNNAH